MGKKVVLGIIVLTCALTLYLAFNNGTVPSGKASYNSRDTIGIIRIEGEISGESGDTLLGSSKSTLDQTMDALKDARERNEIKAVVIRIDSPGGTVAASQEIAEEIDKVRKSGKPVIASMGDTAASGAYWIACSCDRIMANPGTLTGSIGVIMSISNVEGLFQKLGIREDVIKSGSLKDLGSSTRQMTPEERKVLQDMVIDTYQQFLTQVKRGRKGKIEESRLVALADGRVFTGRQAKKLGLVDDLGNFADAVDLAASESHIKGEPVVEELMSPDPFQIFNQISSKTFLKNDKLLNAVY